MATRTMGWSGSVGVLLVGLFATVAPTTAWAQASAIRTVSVPFSGASATMDGYTQASMQVSYAFIACHGEIHIAYSLQEGSLVTGNQYALGGMVYPTIGPPPQPSSIEFAGTVYRGPSIVGSFADGLTGRALGMGCFSGQIQKITNVRDVLGPGATQGQIDAYLDSLSLQVRPGRELRSSSEESRIRGELRRMEAAAAEAERHREQETIRAAEAERADQAQRMADAQSAGAAAPGTSAGPAQPATPPLSREQRIANAIASDNALAEERLEQQRAAYAQQQAEMAALQEQQAAVAIAAVPVVVDLAGSLYGALEAWDARVKATRFETAQARLAGQCLLPNGMTAPKDGELQLGVPMTVPMGKDDCGQHPGDRYKSLLLEIPEAQRVRFTIKPSKWRIFTSFQIDVRDLDNTSHMFLGWQEWGGMQKTNSKDALLPAGVYIVTVSNGVEDIFYGFDIRVDPLGPG